MNQKLEELLQLALQTPEETRKQTEQLNVGFQSVERTWEVIVKYHGSLEQLTVLGVEIEYLIAGYAILTVSEQLVETVAELEEIEYVEKPKRYFYQVTDPAQESCIVQVTGRDFSLSGEGVLIAVLDSGIDYRLPVFRKADGSTRIRFLWDQAFRTEREAGLLPDSGYDLELRPPQGFRQGVEWSAEQINAVLQEQTQAVPAVGTDISGHGTAVAGIAAGLSAAESAVGNENMLWSEAEQSTYRGVAPGAELLIVKLGTPDALSFPRTTEIMRAVTWALGKAQELRMPLVINLSFGNSYGAHDGSSLLERFLDQAADIGRTVVGVGSGNEGASDGHIAGTLERVADSTTGMQGRPAVIELAVAEYESSLSIQLWKNYSDVYRIFLRSPGGQEAELPSAVAQGKYVLQLEQTELLIYIGEPTPYAAAQEIYLELIPLGQPYIGSGVWSFRLEPVEIVTGNYYFYLASAATRSTRTGFFRSTPDVTLTIPATASKVITVGAYDSVYDSYADFSGRGYADLERTIGVVTAGLVKPDLVAPGVGVRAPDVYGGYTAFTGTSFATPIVAGSAALLMEWGIVRGNDPFLYGEKVKAYLRKGARPLRGELSYPNARVGWGKLCLAESFPE